MADVDRYPAQVFWSEEDAGFIAIAPDLSGCSAFGANQQKAITELHHAIAAWKAAAAEAGNSVPEPSQAATQFSGKFPLRLPKSLHGQLSKQAELDGVSLNTYIIYRLTSEHEKNVASAREHFVSDKMIRASSSDRG